MSLPAAGRLAAQSGEGLTQSPFFSHPPFAEQARQVFRILHPEDTGRTASEISLRAVASLAKERDPELFFAEVHHLALRELRADRPETAQALFAWIAQGEPTAPASARRKAQREFDAMVGQGDAGQRAEFLAGQFFQQATDAKMIGPMILSSTVYQVTRSAVLGRLLAGSEGLWLTRGFGARATASLAGFVAEVPTFALGSRTLLSASGAGVSWDGAAVGQDLLAATLTLGALKAFGHLGNQGYSRAQALRGNLSAPARWQSLSRAAFSQSSMFVGLSAAHQLEEAAGLRLHLDGATATLDTLATMLSLGVGARLGHKFLGARFATFQQELGQRSSIVGPVVAANDSEYRMPPPRIGTVADPRERSANIGDYQEREIEMFPLAAGAEGMSRFLPRASKSDSGPKDPWRGGTMPLPQAIQGKGQAVVPSFQDLKWKVSLPERCGPGWAYLSDAHGNFFQVAVQEIPERSGGVFPTQFVSRAEWSPLRPLFGELGLDIHDVSQGTTRRLVLHTDDQALLNLGFSWPEQPAQLTLPDRSLLTVRSSLEVLEGFKNLLEQYSKIGRWSPRMIEDVRALLDRVDNFRKVMGHEKFPWMEAFLHEQGKRLSPEVETAPQKMERKPFSWLTLSQVDGTVVRVRATSKQALARRASPQGEFKHGTLIVANSTHLITLEGRSLKVQGTGGGTYSLRLQFNASKDGSQGIDLRVDKKTASDLGLSFYRDFLILPPVPLLVEVQGDGKSPQERDWVNVDTASGRYLKIQGEWKGRSHVVIMEGGTTYGTLAPCMDSPVELANGDLLLKPIIQQYRLEMSWTDATGKHRTELLWVDANKASQLGLQVQDQGLVFPKNHYFLIRIEDVPRVRPPPRRKRK